MRAEIEAAFVATIAKESPPGAHPPVRAGLNGPAVGITPLAWSQVLKSDADLAAVGEGLAMAGLYYGCTQFARLTVQDRPEVRVASQGGRGITRKRPRAFVVHALGWGHPADPEFVHVRSWPHAIGAEVPETSKRPKGDAQ